MKKKQFDSRVYFGVSALFFLTAALGNQNLYLVLGTVFLVLGFVNRNKMK